MARRRVLIGLALLLAAAPSADACARYPAYELQPCEYQRYARADVLDAAGRRQAGRLGPDAIRFSTRPSLGGYAIVIEIVPMGGGRGGARLLTFYGHPGLGWEPDDDDWAMLSAAEYRQLTAQVDAALARSPEPVADPDNGETVVCTDGPGFLTERVRDGVVVHLTGSCPISETENHPNETIAVAIQDLLCRHREPEAERIYWRGRRCFERVLTMAEWQASHGQQ